MLLSNRREQRQQEQVSDRKGGSGRTGVPGRMGVSGSMGVSGRRGGHQSPSLCVPMASAGERCNLCHVAWSCQPAD